MSMSVGHSVENPINNHHLPLNDTENSVNENNLENANPKLRAHNRVLGAIKMISLKVFQTLYRISFGTLSLVGAAVAGGGAILAGAFGGIAQGACELAGKHDLAKRVSHKSAQFSGDLGCATLIAFHRAVANIGGGLAIPLYPVIKAVGTKMAKDSTVPNDFGIKTKIQTLMHSFTNHVEKACLIEEDQDTGMRSKLYNQFILNPQNAEISTDANYTPAIYAKKIFKFIADDQKAIMKFMGIVES